MAYTNDPYKKIQEAVDDEKMLYNMEMPMDASGTPGEYSNAINPYNTSGIQNISNAMYGTPAPAPAPPTSAPASQPQAQQQATTQSTAMPKGVTNSYGVTDNSAAIQQMYTQQLNAAVTSIKQSIANSKSSMEGNVIDARAYSEGQKNRVDMEYQLGQNQYNRMIEDAPAKYDPMRSQSEVQRQQGMRTLEEAIANRGDRGGLGRQEVLNSDLAGQNRLTSINLAQSNEIRDANRGIADLSARKAMSVADVELELQKTINQTDREIAQLEANGQLEEARMAADMGAQRIMALLGESTRVEESTYGRQQDAQAASERAEDRAYSRSRDAEQMSYQKLRDAINDTRYDSEDAYRRSQEEEDDAIRAEERAYGRSRDATIDARYDSETTYGRSRDTITDARYDAERAYGIGEDEEDDARYDDEIAYNRGRDTIADTRYETESQQRARAAEQARIDSIAESMGIVPNPTAGVAVPTDIRQQLEQYANQNGGYQAFIDSNTDPNLDYWANVLRNEKIYNNLNQFGQYGTKTQDTIIAGEQLARDDRDYQEGVRRFNQNFELDMNKFTFDQAQTEIDNSYKAGNLTLDQSQDALNWAKFEWDKSAENPSNQRKPTATDTGTEDPVSVITADLQSMPIEDAYQELSQYANDYIAEMGIEAYNKLFAAYKKAYYGS